MLKTSEHEVAFYQFSVKKVDEKLGILIYVRWCDFGGGKGSDKLKLHLRGIRVNKKMAKVDSWRVTI